MKFLAMGLFLLAPQDEATIARWIAELAHESLDVRERALESLVKAGRGAEEPLRAAAKSANEEVRARAAQALAEIARRERVRAYDPGPTLITLSKKDATLREVLDEISKQARVAIDAGDAPVADRLSVTFERTPLLRAVDELTRRHGGLSWRVKDERVVLSKGRSDPCPRAFDEQFAVRLTSVRLTSRYDGRGGVRDETALSFDWAWEPGSRHCGGVIWIEQVRDDAGHSYAAQFRKLPRPQLEANFLSPDLGTNMVLSIHAMPADGARTFALIKGAVEILIPEDVEQAIFDDPTQQAGGERKLGDGRVKLVAFSRDAKEWRVRLEMRPSDLAERVEIALVDSKGRFLSTTSRSEGSDGERSDVSITYAAAGIEPAAVRLRRPIGSRVKRIPFEFRDIRFRP